MNKLFILRPRNPCYTGKSPWNPWYDKVFGFVVCAKDEKEARKLAQEDGGDEIRDSKYNSFPAWTDSKYSTCRELAPINKPKIIIKDFAAA